MIPVPIKQLPNSPYPLKEEDTDIPFIEDESRQSNSKLSILLLYYNIICIVVFNNLHYEKIVLLKLSN